MRRFARACFICACMDAPTELELCLYDQLDIAKLACYLLPYFLLQYLLPL